MWIPSLFAAPLLCRCLCSLSLVLFVSHSFKFVPVHREKIGRSRANERESERSISTHSTSICISSKNKRRKTFRVAVRTWVVWIPKRVHSLFAFFVWFVFSSLCAKNDSKWFSLFRWLYTLWPEQKAPLESLKLHNFFPNRQTFFLRLFHIHSN